MTRRTIFVTGYPKSGCTWLTRLLAEVLDSPSGGCRPQDDRNEVATEGQDRLGDFVVRKGHFRPIQGTAELVSMEHRLSIKHIDNNFVVMIHRDPRDVIVSGAYYWRRNVIEQLEMVIRGNGSMRLHGPWNVFISEWVQYEKKPWFANVSYESLLEDTFLAITNILWRLQIEIPETPQIKQAIENQSFGRKKKELIANPHNAKYDSKFHRHFMRKGRVGDWVKHFDEKMSFRVESSLGHWMRYLGYELS